MSNANESQDNQRNARLLLIGALVGALLASSGLLEERADGLPENVVATVNGDSITRAEYLAFLDLLARDKRNPVSAADRRHVLDRIIEEKLLVERGLDIDLPRSDPSVRKGIVNAMIDTAISDVSSREPTDEELEGFYADNLGYFTHPARARLERLVFRGDGDGERAAAAYRDLADRPWADVGESWADTDILALPGSLLPVAKLRGYLGPSLTEAALALEVGQYSAVLPDQGGYTILHLLELQHGQPPPLGSIREQVSREYQRRAGDAALRSYLGRLRAQAEVNIDEAFLDSLDSPDPSGD